MGVAGTTNRFKLFGQVEEARAPPEYFPGEHEILARRTWNHKDLDLSLILFYIYLFLHPTCLLLEESDDLFHSTLMTDFI